MPSSRTLAPIAALVALLVAAPAAAQDAVDGAAAGAPAEPPGTAGGDLAADDDGGGPARFPPSSVRWKLVAGGVGLTAAAYGIGAACAAAWPEVPGSDALYIPVAGPWITLGQSGCSPDDPGCEAIVVVRGILLVLDGLVQAGGLAVAGEGLFMTTESETARAPMHRPRPSRATAITVTPVPVVTERQTGVGVVGSF